MTSLMKPASKVIQRYKEYGVLEENQECTEHLQKAGFRIAPELLAQVLVQ